MRGILLRIEIKNAFIILRNARFYHFKSAQLGESKGSKSYDIDKDSGEGKCLPWKYDQ